MTRVQRTPHWPGCNALCTGPPAPWLGCARTIVNVAKPERRTSPLRPCTCIFVKMKAVCSNNKPGMTLGRTLAWRSARTFLHLQSQAVPHWGAGHPPAAVTRVKWSHHQYLQRVPSVWRVHGVISMCNPALNWCSLCQGLISGGTHMCCSWQRQGAWSLNHALRFDMEAWTRKHWGCSREASGAILLLVGTSQTCSCRSFWVQSHAPTTPDKT